MIRLPVALADIDAGQARFREVDACRVAAGLPNRRVADTATAARGHTAEYVFSEWLDTYGVGHELFGGFDTDPDVWLHDGRRVGVRYCGNRFPWLPAHHVNVWARELDRHDDFVFIGPVVSHLTDLMLLGFATPLMFTDGTAEFVRAGETCRSGFRPIADCWRMTVAYLTPPDSWLELVGA